MRNLNISNTSIANISEWIGELHHLQTFRPKRWGLTKLPSTLKYLINIRHLYVLCDTKLPAGIGELTSLQTLEHFNVGKEKGYQIEELGSLKNLKGAVDIKNLERVRDKEESMKANMSEKSNLSKLVFRWGCESVSERNDESVLEGLQPHLNVKELTIDGYKGKRFPTWIEKMKIWDGLQCTWVPLDNLTHISLEYCSECEEIPTLEHLPNLNSVHLLGLWKVRVKNSSFNNLRTLTLAMLELKCLPEPLFYNNQNLLKLSIYRCSALRELPDGLDTLNALEE